MAKPTFGYWDRRGLAEPIRYLLHYKNVLFEDKRYQFDSDAWKREKFTLDLDFPNLPYYIDENVKLTQSTTILRYLAKRHDLEGKTEEEMLRVSLAEQQITDFRQKFFNLCANKDFENLKEKFLQQLPDQLRYLEHFFGERKFLAGDHVTYVDFMAYDAINFHVYLSKTCLDEFPILKNYQYKIRSLHRLHHYLISPSYRRWPIVRPVNTWGGKGDEPN